jgi:hypothetical protein
MFPCKGNIRIDHESDEYNRGWINDEDFNRFDAMELRSAILEKHCQGEISCR